MNQTPESPSLTRTQPTVALSGESNVSDYLAAIDAELRRVMSITDARYADFFNTLHYHLGWTDFHGSPAFADTGKRIRPLLALWTCQAVGGNWRDALPAAAAIELIHNFSLIHDDIQDSSESRRGRPTVWSLWGVAQGINAGDAMFVLAHQALNDIPANLTLDGYVAIQRVFNGAILKLTQGQYLDLAYERADQVDLEQYFEMVRGKTAALLAAACEVGARIGSNAPQLYQTFAHFGEQLGIAFQIADDVLGLWGDAKVTGKSARTDLYSRKKSFPVMYAMQTGAGQELRALYAKQEWTDREVQQIEKILDETHSREHALRQAEIYAREAETALDATHLDNPALTRLRNLIQQIVHREK